MITYKNNIEYYGLLFLAFFPLYPFFLLSIGIGVYLISVFLSRYLGKVKQEKTNYHFIFLSVLFYLFLVFKAFLNENYIEEIKYFRSSVSLLIFPLAWLISNKPISSKQRKNVIKIFVYSSFILAIYIVFFSLFFTLKTNRNFNIFYEEIPIINVHPNYASLYFLTAILFIYLNLKESKSKIIDVLLMLFFTTILFILAVRVVIVALLIILSIEFLFNKQFSTITKSSIFIGVILLAVFSFFIIKPFNKKIKETILLQKIELPYAKFPTSTQIRLGIYDCALPIIEKNFFFGVGAQSFEKEINECYKKFNNYDKVNYNTHNYYLFLLGSSGIFSLLSFVYLFVLHLKKAVALKDHLYFYVLISLLITLLTENFLSRVQGAIFAMFFITLFIKSNNLLVEK